jgi:hypothetical protein
MLMNDLFVQARSSRCTVGLIALAALFASAPALAQAPAAPAPVPGAAAPATSGASPAAAPATEGPAAEPAPAPTPEAAAPAVPAPPPAPPLPPASEFPPIAVGIWTRLSLAAQGQDDPEKLDDVRFDTQFVELNFSGQIHKNVKMATNIYANGLSDEFGTSGGFHVLDAWVGFDVVDELHLSVGQLLIPIDRANKSGPFFMIPWNYPGIFQVGPTLVAVTPYEGTRGRSLGGILWGDIGKGFFKYYLGAFVPSLDVSPLYSGRLSAALIGKETGFGQRGSYYGEQTIVSVSVGGQFQKDGSVGTAPAGGGAAPTSDASELNADLLAEFKLGSNGAFVSGDAAYYHYEGDFAPAKDQVSVMAAYTTAMIGLGQIQPMVRYQFATGDNNRTEAALDAQLGYVMRQQRLRVIANYQLTKLQNQTPGAGDLTGNKVQLAVQAMFY